MRKALLVALITALAWGGAAALAQEPPPPTGTISGRIVNGTPDGPLPTGLSVQLGEMVGTILRPVATASGADDGGFTFQDVPADPTKIYVVAAEYAGVTYESGPLQFADAQAEATTEVRVYETTEAKNAVSIEFQHMIVEPDSASGRLIISETVRVANSGDRTYVGQEPKHEGMASGVVKFTLPEGAHGLELYNGITQDDVVADEFGGFFDTRPLPPGSREVAFGYGLPYQGDSAAFRRVLDYPTTKTVVLVRSAQPPESPVFPAWEARDLQLTNGQTATYFQSQVEGLTPATPLEITFRGLPPPPPPVSDEGARKLSLFLGALGLAAALGLIVYALSRRRGAPAWSRERTEV